MAQETKTVAEATETKATSAEDRYWMQMKACFLLTDYICKIIRYNVAKHKGLV